MDADSGAGEPANVTAEELSVDTVFNLLADQRRRLAIDCLKLHESALSLADVAEEVAVRENEAPISEIDADEVLQVYTSLYHNHVPRLADAGVVAYEQERDLVRLSGNADRVITVASDLSEGGASGK